jgi:diguanylate cyclase (GGDEF)-like protein
MNELPHWLARLRARWKATHWSHYLLYALPVVPFLTDLDETGRIPATAREWTTETAVGLLIALLVRRIRKDFILAQTAARTDALTGLGNRRAFDQALLDESIRSERLGQTLCLVYLDVNKFKAINDNSGHAAGDQVLRYVGMVIGKVIRRHVDHGFRLGGDEFALLLPGSTLDEAAAVAGRIREGCRHAGPDVVLQVSVGICQLEAHETPSRFVRRADKAMYAEKQAQALPCSRDTP